MHDQKQAIKKDFSLPAGKDQEIMSEDRKFVMPGKYGYGKTVTGNTSKIQDTGQESISSLPKSSHQFGNISLHPGPVMVVQPKLSVNEPGDAYEQEADVVAEKIMRTADKGPVINTPSPIKIQRKCETCGKEEMEEEKEEKESPTDSMIQRKCAACEEEEKNKLYRKESGSSGPVASANVHQVIQSPGQPLDNATRSFMENRFGFDFGKVQIHNNSLAHQSAKDINALAYTHQHHIAFGAGQYQPNTDSGKKLLAHELTHTIQQNGNNIRRQVKLDHVQMSSARFIVDDDMSPAEGVMTKSEFMATLNEAVCNAVNEELQGTQYSSGNCPYIRAIFTRQANSSPAQIEELITQYEPSTAAANSAADMIQLILVRVRVAVNQWRQRQSLADVSGDITGMLSAISLGPRGAGVTPADENPSLQFMANPGGATNIQSPRAVMKNLGKGHALDSNTRSQMESAFETSFGNVEVHTDNHAANIASNMNAKAFAVGNHIAFASGEHKPGTLIGDALMAHELAHVVQQENGETSSITSSGTHLESDADHAAYAAVSNIWQKGKKNKKQAMPKARTGLSLHRCEDSLSSLFSSEEAKDAGTDASTEAPVPTTVPPFEQKDSTTGATLGTTAGHQVKAYYFQGTSDRKALIMSGVHGSEPGGVEVVHDLLSLMQSAGAPTPFFSVIIVPELFSANVNDTSRKLWERRKSTGKVSALNAKGKATTVDVPDPNRQFPAVGTDPVTDPTLNCVVDEQNRCVEPENLVLLDLINKFQPERVASVHGHSIPQPKKDATVEQQLKTGGGPSITTDPRPGQETEDHVLTLAMAKEAHKRKVNVPGNFIGTKDETTTYPTGTAAHDPGISFGAWGSHATPTRPAMNIVLIETYGNRTSKVGTDAEKAAKKTELMNLAEILRDFFLVDPSTLPTP